MREYLRPAVEEGLRVAGRSRADFTLASSTFAIIGDSEAERSRAAEVVRRQIAFYASTRTYQLVLATHGWERLLPELHRKSRGGLERNGIANWRRNAGNICGFRDVGERGGTIARSLCRSTARPHVTL